MQREIITIDDALARMDTNLDRAIETGDARGYFTAVYRGVTARVRDGIAAGEFEDNPRMERLDVRFARYWLDAYAAWDQSQPTSRSWAKAFTAAQRGGTVMQHLVLGINAHINLDLAVASAAVAPGAELDALRADFMKINDVLGELVDEMQESMGEVVPVTGLLDVLAAGIDEALVNFSLNVARDKAWEFAARLAAAGSPEAMVHERDAMVARYADTIADPPAVVEFLMELTSWGQKQDVGANVAALAHRAAQPRVVTAPVAVTTVDWG
jgi:hypothetical protein